jgi:hypothetical protein
MTSLQSYLTADGGIHEHALDRLVMKLNSNDILMGRGAPHTYYQGNVKFRELVQTRKQEYASLKLHREKHDVAMQLYDEVHRRNGRFVEAVPAAIVAKMRGHPTPQEQLWFVVDKVVAVDKIKQALREKRCPMPASIPLQSISTFPSESATECDDTVTSVTRGCTPDSHTVDVSQLIPTQGARTVLPPYYNAAGHQLLQPVHMCRQSQPDPLIGNQMPQPDLPSHLLHSIRCQFPSRADSPSETHSSMFQRSTVGPFDRILDHCVRSLLESRDGTSGSNSVLPIVVPYRALHPPVLLGTAPEPSCPNQFRPTDMLTLGPFYDMISRATRCVDRPLLTNSAHNELEMFNCGGGLGGSMDNDATQATMESLTPSDGESVDVDDMDVDYSHLQGLKRPSSSWQILTPDISSKRAKTE